MSELNTTLKGEFAKSNTWFINLNHKSKLKDVADNYGKEHGKLVKQFYSDVAQLDEDEIPSLHFGEMVFESKGGKKRTTGHL